MSLNTALCCKVNSSFFLKVGDTFIVPLPNTSKERWTVFPKCSCVVAFKGTYLLFPVSIVIIQVIFLAEYVVF